MDGDAPAATLLRGYVQDVGIPAFVLEELADRFPGTVESLYRVAFARPDFTFQPDGEALLRRYKPSSHRNAQLPRLALAR